MTKLLMLSPAPMLEAPGGEVVLDVKFVEGMKLHCQLWPGRVCCVMWRGNPQIEEPMRYSIAQLGFELVMLDPGAPVPQLLLDDCAMVYCSGDDMKHLDLPNQMRNRFGKLVYSLDKNMRGRISTAFSIESSLRRRIGTTLWSLRNEWKLRRALRYADGIHCNGYPAFETYRKVNTHALHYLDNRIRAPMLLRGADAEARVERLRGNEPLRLAWFGQLTPESGVEDLLPMAHLLANRGQAFHLEIAGVGPVAPRLRDGVAALGLSDYVTLSGSRRFESQLVPGLRKSADLYLSTQRGPDPLASYVEALGCGLPILGYRNAMTKRIAHHSGAAFLVRRGSAGALARMVERLDGRRDEIIAASTKAVEFARANSFEQVFASRMTDLRDIANQI